nr:dolichyl pyrophosphate Glc1Man9GlcNAc2 [Hymenolepis microstoma]
MVPYGNFLIVIAAVAFKSLLFSAYHSTDFEVHRNWLSITYSTEFSQWYTEATSIWTLDYPPFFAYFEFLLAHLGNKVDPNMTVVSAEPYVSPGTVYFQRITVIVSELLLMHSISKLLTVVFGPLNEKKEPLYLTAFSLFAFNFGLFIVDHVHFQYNGFLFGILFISILKTFQSDYLWSGFWFAVLLNFKHTFFYLAPVYLVFMLSHYCLDRYDGNLPIKIKWNHLLAMGALVCSVFAVSIGPFILMGRLPDLLSRLFPFNRGLCHAYWAPNFWALYNLADKALGASGLFPNFCSKGPQEASYNQVSMTSGLTGNYHHLCLPTIRPIYTAFLTATYIIPGLVICTGQKNSIKSGFILVRAIVSAAWASFLFGWHVHEKAVLVITLPLTLLAVVSRRLRGLCFYVSTIAHFSLLPLIFTPNEQPVILSFYLLYTLVQYLLLGRSSIPVSNGFLAKYWHHFTVLGKIHLLGLIPLLLLTRIALPLLYPRLEFLPLMMVSVYCAVGLTVSFFIYTWINFSWMREEKLAKLQEEMEDAVYDAKASFFKKND